MDGPVHEGDEGREGRDGEERARAGVLQADMQAALPPHEARVRLRRRHARPQAPDGDCAPQAAGERAGEGPEDRRETPHQSR